jgi:PAS domain S-box-containing protein
VAGQDGQLIERYWSAINKPVFSPDGRVAYIIHTAEDITALINSEKREEEHQVLQQAYIKVQESEAALKRFQFMADNALDPFILMREDGTFAYLNKKGLDVWDYTNEEVRPIRVPDVDRLYNDVAYKELFEKAQRETIPQFETLYKRKNGHVFPVELNVNGIMLNGKPHLFAIARDISERRKQEEVFEAQNVLIRTITENATSTLFMMNAKGYCTFMNVAGEKMFGYSQEEIRSKPKDW